MAMPLYARMLVATLALSAISLLLLLHPVI
jgi:hypothetical protein